MRLLIFDEGQLFVPAYNSALEVSEKAALLVIMDHIEFVRKDA